MWLQWEMASKWFVCAYLVSVCVCVCVCVVWGYVLKFDID